MIYLLGKSNTYKEIVKNTFTYTNIAYIISHSSNSLVNNFVFYCYFCRLKTGEHGPKEIILIIQEGVHSFKVLIFDKFK